MAPILVGKQKMRVTMTKKTKKTANGKRREAKMRKRTKRKKWIKAGIQNPYSIASLC
jgi:hypothetical protein